MTSVISNDVPYIWKFMKCNDRLRVNKSGLSNKRLNEMASRLQVLCTCYKQFFSDGNPVFRANFE